MQTLEIGLIITLAGGVIGLSTFWIGRKTAAKKDGYEWGSFQTELKKDIEYIKRDISDLKISVDGSIQEMKASLRRAHRRLDDHLRNDHSMSVPRDYNED